MKWSISYSLSAITIARCPPLDRRYALLSSLLLLRLDRRSRRWFPGAGWAAAPVRRCSGSWGGAAEGARDFPVSCLFRLVLDLGCIFDVRSVSFAGMPIRSDRLPELISWRIWVSLARFSDYYSRLSVWKLVLSRIDSWSFCYRLISALPCLCVLIVDKIASANCWDCNENKLRVWIVEILQNLDFKYIRSGIKYMNELRNECTIKPEDKFLQLKLFDTMDLLYDRKEMLINRSLLGWKWMSERERSFRNFNGFPIAPWAKNKL